MYSMKLFEEYDSKPASGEDSPKQVKKSKVDKSAKEFVKLLTTIAEIFAKQKYDIHNEFRNLKRKGISFTQLIKLLEDNKIVLNSKLKVLLKSAYLISDKEIDLEALKKDVLKHAPKDSFEKDNIDEDEVNQLI